MENYFISYNHNDLAWAEWIDWVLRANDKDTTVQVYDFKTGGNFVLAMHKALKQGDHVIGVLTKHFLDSDWCAEEWSGALDKLILVRVANVKPDGILKNRAYIDLFGLPEDRAMRALLDALKDNVRPTEKPPFPPGGKPAFPGKPLPPNNLPNRNPHFTGRGEILDSIHRAFQTGQAVSLKQTVAGLGGVGKTQTAIEYAYRYAGDYDDIWWVNAESGLQDAYRDFAVSKKILSPEETVNWPAVLSVVKGWFDEHARYLFLFDNVEDFGPLDECLPRATGHVLITTRNEHSPVGKHVDIAVFSEEEAAAFLTERLGRGEGREALAERLGYLPLALEQAAAYIKANHETCSGYLTLLDEEGLDMFNDADARDYQYKTTVNATWKISFDKIKEPSAKQLLNLCAYLAPDGIPLDMLIEGKDKLPEPLRTALEKHRSRNKTVRELTRYSLVKEKDGLLSLHRLLQEVVREGLAGDTSWAEYCVDMMRAVFGYEWGDVASMAAFKARLPHALEAAGYGERLPEEDEGRLDKVRWLYYWAGWGLDHNGQYEQALEWRKKNLAINEKVKGPEHPDTAATYNNLAIVYLAQGKYDEALELHQKALDIKEKVLGTGHPDTAATYNNIALVYKEQGKYDKALELYQKASDIYEKVLGTGHPDTAITYYNLALLYEEMGDTDKALAFYQKALAAEEKILGPDHPSTRLTTGNLERLLAKLGRGAEG